jgi:hypothetical protein
MGRSIIFTLSITERRLSISSSSKEGSGAREAPQRLPCTFLVHFANLEDKDDEEEEEDNEFEFVPLFAELDLSAK